MVSHGYMVSHYRGVVQRTEHITLRSTSVEGQGGGNIMTNSLIITERCSHEIQSQVQIKAPGSRSKCLRISFFSIRVVKAEL